MKQPPDLRFLAIILIITAVILLFSTRSLTGAAVASPDMGSSGLMMILVLLIAGGFAVYLWKRKGDD